MITVLFFGRIADVMQARSITVPVAPHCASLSALRDSLFADALALGRVQPDAIRMSLNQAMARGDAAVGDGDEVAFFSVFSGG